GNLWVCASMRTATIYRNTIYCNSFPTAVARVGIMPENASSPVTKADFEMLASFRYELRRFLHFSEGAAREAGLTPGQHQALLAVKGFPGKDRITIGELAERLQVAHHSAVGLVDRLAANDL